MDLDPETRAAEAEAAKAARAALQSQRTAASKDRQAKLLKADQTKLAGYDKIVIDAVAAWKAAVAATDQAIKAYRLDLNARKTVLEAAAGSTAAAIQKALQDHWKIGDALELKLADNPDGAETAWDTAPDAAAKATYNGLSATERAAAQQAGAAYLARAEDRLKRGGAKAKELQDQLKVVDALHRDLEAMVHADPAGTIDAYIQWLLADHALGQVEAMVATTAAAFTASLDAERDAAAAVAARLRLLDAAKDDRAAALQDATADLAEHQAIDVRSLAKAAVPAPAPAPPAPAESAPAAGTPADTTPAAPEAVGEGPTV